MQGLPFKIPGSLSSYVSQFESDPDKSIDKLKTHLTRRGSDAVGYFLLSWLYHINGQQEEAIDSALKSKCCAPGSPFLEHLHYFLVHPDRFNAWKPFHGKFGENDQDPPMVQSGYTLDLDLLIEQLSKAENKKITISPDSKDSRDLGKTSENVGDIASETLVHIYEKQKRYPEAIRTLKKLKHIKPHKNDEYTAEIHRIESLMSEKEESND